MSIALERSRNGVERAGFVRVISSIPAYGSPEIGAGREFPAAAEEMGENGRDSASCSSSIGRNSDCSRGSAGSDGVDSGEPEVQSALKGPLDTMDALGDSLPVRQGISRFYPGKSKSFTSLADVSSSSSAKDFAKPENAYTRKRKNLLAFCSSWERRQSDPLTGVGGSMLKKPANSSRSTLSLVCGMSSSDSNNVEEEHEPSLCCLLHPNGKLSPSPCDASPSQRCYFSVRSFSLTDLQGASTCSCSSSSSSPRGMVERIH